MKKRVFYVLLSLTLISLWSFNVFKTNNSVNIPSKKIYSMGEFVDYGNDFFDKSIEKRNGYSIKVLYAEVIEFDEFLKQNNISIQRDKNTFKPKYIYNVRVIIKNENNTDSGISLLDTTLNSLNDIMQVDFDVFDALYPQLYGAVSFSLKPKTEMEFQLPFVVANEEFEKICNYEYLTNKTFYLSLSQYPIEKSIEIHI